MLPHTLITASAGSGKTWRLTVRYLRLIMMGAAPESIVALTFSRKAAGEFFNAILHRLAEAAADASAAAALARDIGMPETTSADFCQALVRLTARLPALMLGTLDSFFIRLARSFPFELGLSGEFVLLDPHQLAVEKQRVFERVFAPVAGPDTARDEFRRAFTEATWGKDEIRIRSLLEEFVRNWHDQFLTAPDPDLWGNPDRIWPEHPPVPGPAIDLPATLARIERGLSSLGMTAKHQERWSVFLREAAGHTPGTPVPRDMAYLWTRLLPLLPALASGGAHLKMDRTVYRLSGPSAEAVTALLRHLIAGEVETALRRTRGIYEVIRRYDAAWHTLVRRQGLLTFQDVQLLLSGQLSPEASGHEARATRLPTHQENRQLMDYRLDARYHHWLLDEFQDTSRTQWRVLENLMDEAIQDSEGIRSFFAVGDEKQSIYEWRGGTPALFRELQVRYHHPGLPAEHQLLRVEPLSLSRRSGPAVIAMVNRLFGDSAAMKEVLPDAAVKRWQWQSHESCQPDGDGAALVLEADSRDTAQEDGTSPDSDAAWQRTAGLVRQLQPLKRGLTCAVICHHNKRAVALTNFLRAATGMPVICESDLSVAADNPVTSALLALLQAAAHPGDRFAWEHVRMTPLYAVLTHHFSMAAAGTGPGMDAVRRPASLRILQQIAENGFHDTLRWWARELTTMLRRQNGDLDGFSLSRIDSLCGCAREFDDTGSRDTDEFLTFAASWTERGVSHDGAVQVMTVHRSKGLTFDVVIIPDLGYPFTFQNRFFTGRETDAGGEVRWLTALPGKEITATDAVLSAARDRAEGDAWCERIAGLYVMVTRARYANYLFLPPPPKTPSATPSLPALIRQMLQQESPGTYPSGDGDCPIIAAFGNPEWYLAFPLKSPPPAARPAAPGILQPDLFSLPGEPAAAPPVPNALPLPFRRPSGAGSQGEEERPFQSARAAARDAGIAVHAVFQRILWRDAAEAALAGPGLAPQAVAEVRACLADWTLREFFTCPPGKTTVWREQAFEVILDGVRHSGVLDRVVVRHGPGGAPDSAVLLDFKTGTPHPSPEEAAAKHRLQLKIYHHALQRLLGLPASKIRTVVLFTAVRQAVDL